MEINHARYGLVKFIYFGISSFFMSPTTPEAEQHSTRNAFFTYMNSSHIPDHCFCEREERGVFFFLHHCPGNLIHTEYNREERERLDRGLEDIMKFVHIQASWMVLSSRLSLSLNCPPIFSSDCPAQLSHPQQKKSTRLIALGEAEWAALWDDLVPICVCQ